MPKSKRRKAAVRLLKTTGQIQKRIQDEINGPKTAAQFSLVGLMTDVRDLAKRLEDFVVELGNG